MRRTGIEVIGNAPWGTHLCQFYESPRDLIDILVPYFRQGLADNEFCMWVTSEPLGVAEATAALASAEPALRDCLGKGQIEILDYTQWYTRGGRFVAQEVLRGWVEKLDGALKRGYAGLRLTGNTFWLEKKDWADFTAYEQAVDRVISRYRMLAVCTYSLARCGAAEIMDVVGNHRYALVKRSGRWQAIESSEGKRAEEAVRRLAQFPEQNPNPVLRVAADGALVYANQPARTWLGALGWQPGGPLPAAVREVAADAGRRDRASELELGGPGGLTFAVSALRPPGEDYVNLYARDITDRKAAEKALRRRAEELRAANEELTRFNHAMVDRELRMVELKRQVNALCLQAGKPPPYPVEPEPLPE